MQPLNRNQKLIIQGTTRLPIVWRTPSIVFGGLGLAALVAVEFTEYDHWSVLGWICALGLVYAIDILRRGFRDGPRRVLTDPFLVLVSSFALYFLFGTLVLVIGPEGQASDASRWYPTTAVDAVRITAMNLLGLATMLFAAGFFPIKRIESFAQPAIANFSKFPTQKLFWLFFCIGGSANLLVLFVDIAATGGIVVSGTIRMLASLTQFAILVGILCRGRGAGVLHVMALTLAIFNSATGLLFFNKSAAIMPILVLFLGLYIRQPSLKLIVAFFTVLAAFLLFIAKPIGDARTLLVKGGNYSVSARLQILNRVFAPNATKPDHSSGVWSRLCYTTAQVAAVDLYEKKQGGRDVELLAWVFVPRVLFPNKPIMTRSGTEFNKQVTGSDSSSSGIGLFISGYYNLGWVGLFMASIVAGWILATFAAISRAIVASSSIIMLPVSLLGLHMAFRIDGAFVADYLGPFGMVMFPFLVLIFMLRVGARKTVTERVR